MQEILDTLARGWSDLLARPGGPFAFRFVLQPLMAVLLAARDGVRDARTGRSPYFWRVMHDAGQRRERLVEAWRATARIGALAMLLDFAYQWRLHDSFYAGEAVVVALLLAFVPYVLVRGPVDRIAGRWIARRTPPQAAPSRVPRGRTT